MNRRQAAWALRNGNSLRLTCDGTSGSVARETHFDVELRPCGMKYTVKGYAHPTHTDVILDGTYRVHVTARQVLSFIRRHFPRVEHKHTFDANMGVCPTPTIGD